MMQQTLSHYFGYETFRPGQEEIISKVLDHRNVLGVLPMVEVSLYAIKYQVYC